MRPRTVEPGELRSETTPIWRSAPKCNSLPAMSLPARGSGTLLRTPSKAVTAVHTREKARAVHGDRDVPKSGCQFRLPAISREGPNAARGPHLRGELRHG